jgi:hypothetical protein
MMAALAAFLLLLLPGPQAQAKKSRSPESVFRGTILMSNKAFPTKAKSVKKYIKTLKKMKKKRFVENKEKKEWKIYTAAFFAKPLNDLEVTVKLYDVTSGRAQFLSSYQQYLSQRGEKSLISYITLERDMVGVNKRIQMVLESKGRRLAIGNFEIIGETKKASGQVDFTKD